MGTPLRTHRTTPVLPLLHVFQLLKDTDSPLVPGLERFHCMYVHSFLYRGVASVSLVCPATAARGAARGGAVGVA